MPKLTTPRKSQRADDPAVASIRTSRHTMPKTRQVADLVIHCSVPRCPATFQVESARANHMSITHSAPWAPDKNVHRRADPCNVPTCPAVFWSKAERLAHTKIAHEWYACHLLQSTEKICMRQFLDVDDMHKHLYESHKDEEFTFECRTCRKEYVSLPRLSSVCEACR
jgi:hypothetical protein